MKIVITGSLGNISRPLAKLLTSEGHYVTVVSSKAERKSEIESLGAHAAIGSVTDTSFLENTFTGADAVYTMVPPPADFYSPTFDAIAYSKTVRESYFEAIRKSGVKRIVNLSSWGAHRSQGIGGIAASHHMEQLLDQLSSEVSITHVRPTSFYTNLLSFIPMIKHRGKIELNYGGEDVVAVVAAEDIADAVSEELLRGGKGRTVRYVASDELSCNEIAVILGNAIGIADLKWTTISDEQAKNNLLMAGLSDAMATSISEITGAIHKGYLAEDYRHHKPVFGRIKVSDFAKKFTEVYRNQK